MRWVIAGITDENPRSKISFDNLTREYVDSILEPLANTLRSYSKGRLNYRLSLADKLQKAVDLVPRSLLRLIMTDIKYLVGFCLVTTFNSSD